MKKSIVLLLVLTVIIAGCGKKKQESNNDYFIYENSSYYKINSYKNYLEYETIFKELNVNYEENKKYILVKYSINPCGENISNYKYYIKNKTLYVDFNLNQTCGVCAPKDDYLIIEVDKDVDDVIVEYKYVSFEKCDHNVAYKPIIYIYPEKEMDLTITLGNSNYLTHTYPKYENKWEVHVSPNGNIYDYHTKRNYYALYWEAIDKTKNDMKEGFVVKGEDTVPFLEEKLSILGLNDYEINEFIIYWIDKLENNKYNYIYFRTTEEVQDYMPISFSSNPDTLIRIIMDYKPLDTKINIKEQNLEKVQREGFTVVEWGGRKL